MDTGDKVGLSPLWLRKRVIKMNHDIHGNDELQKRSTWSKKISYFSTKSPVDPVEIWKKYFMSCEARDYKLLVMAGTNIFTNGWK